MEHRTVLLLEEATEPHGERARERDSCVRPTRSSWIAPHKRTKRNELSTRVGRDKFVVAEEVCGVVFWWWENLTGKEGFERGVSGLIQSANCLKHADSGCGRGEFGQ